MLVEVATAVALLSAPLSPDTVHRDVVRAELASLVRIDTVQGPPGEGVVHIVGFSADARRSLPILGPLMRDHGQIVWYMAVHTPGAQARILSAKDSASVVRDSLIHSLLESEPFTERVLAMANAYWASRGRVVEGGTGHLHIARLSLDQGARLGARFFFPDRFSAHGDTMYTHICAGANGLGDLSEPVDPLVEAFVFAAVSKATFQPRAPLMAAFHTASKRAKVTSVSKDMSTRIRRAQGALWSQLEESVALRRALTDGYATHAGALPFRLSNPL